MRFEHIQSFEWIQFAVVCSKALGLMTFNVMQCIYVVD